MKKLFALLTKKGFDRTYDIDGFTQVECGVWVRND